MTCRLIMAENEQSPITPEDIIKDELIKERNFGEFENKLVSEYQAMIKEANPDCKMNFFDYTPESGESRETVRNRARKFLTVCIFKSLQWLHVLHFFKASFPTINRGKKSTFHQQYYK